jgi:hypothetical protein
MKSKEFYQPTEFSEIKDYSGASTANSKDFELFDESKHTANRLLRVKRISTKQAERWKIMDDGEAVFIVEGSRLSKKEKEYLRTADGFNFLLSLYKEGINTMVSIKSELKTKLNVK